MCAAGPFPPFFERPPWLTGDLQTLRNIIRRPFHDLAPWPERRLEPLLADGDRLVAHSHRPEGAVPTVVILIHGLGGGADSVYVRATARLRRCLGLLRPLLGWGVSCRHRHSDPDHPRAQRSVGSRRRPIAPCRGGGFGAVTPLLPRGGGHVGFHGIGSRVPWHDRCAALFARRLVN